VSGGGNTVAVRVTVSTAGVVFPEASWAVTVMTLLPRVRATLGMVQLEVPVAVPLPPALLAQVTELTATLSAATPLTVIAALEETNVGLGVGTWMAMVGAVMSVKVTVRVLLA